MKTGNIYNSFFRDSTIGKVSLFLSMMAIFFAVSMGETKCLSAESCSVGDDEVFEGNLEIRSTNQFGSTLKSTTTNSNVEIELPNLDGRLLSVPSSFFPMGSNEFLKTDGTGSLVLEALNVQKTDIDGSQGTNGQFLTTDGTQNGTSWGDIPSLNETTFDASNGTLGQILTVNGTGSLEFGEISGGGGSFQAVASQNVTFGAVGLESNGQVRNIQALQDPISAFNISHTPHASNNDTDNSHDLHSFYNSNIDGIVVVYHDADTPSGCDTGMFVDVVHETNGMANPSLTKWGRQCLSNEWGNHSNVSQPSQILTSRGVIRARRYGNEWDESINDYVAVYYGGQGQAQQFYTIPFSVDPLNSTIIVGQEDLIHDEQYCYSDQSCGSQDINQKIYQFNDMAYNTVIGHMMMFWSTYHYNSYQNGYMSNRAFTCTIPITTTSGCASETSYKNRSYIAGSFTQNAISFSPQIWYDHDAQNYLIYHNYLTNNNDCRLSSFRVSGNTSWDFNHGNMLDVISTSNSGVYTEIGGMNSQNGNTYGFRCAETVIGGDVAYDSVNKVWIISSIKDSSYQSGWDMNTDLVFIESSNSQNATPVVLGMVDLQNRVAVANGAVNGSTLCQNVTYEKCTSTLAINQGNWNYDTTTNTFQIYMNSLKDDGDCPLDTYKNTCRSIYEFTMNNSTNVIDISTFKHYKYQSPQKNYHNSVWSGHHPQLWKDAQGTLFAVSFYNNSATGNETMSHAEAFAIADNIDSYIGLVDQSGSASNPVTVYSVGAVVEGFSNLTIGETYFVNSSGQIATTGTYEIGRAIATDKIYISKTR